MFRQFQISEFKHGYLARVTNGSYESQFRKFEQIINKNDGKSEIVNKSEIIEFVTHEKNKEKKAWKSILDIFGGPHGFVSKEDLERILKTFNFLLAARFEKETWQLSNTVNIFRDLAKNTKWHDPYNIEIQPPVAIWSWFSKWEHYFNTK